MQIDGFISRQADSFRGKHEVRERVLLVGYSLSCKTVPIDCIIHYRVNHSDHARYSKPMAMMQAATPR